MSITVRQGSENERVFARLATTEDGIRKAIRRSWFGLGQDLRREANREILRRPKGGRTYIVRSRSGRRRRHVASAADPPTPGETHANLKGDLRRSLSWKVHGTESMDFGYGLVSGTGRTAPKYAPFVEFGTRRMAARPSLSNAIDATQANAEQHWGENMFREFNL